MYHPTHQTNPVLEALTLILACVGFSLCVTLFAILAKCMHWD